MQKIWPYPWNSGPPGISKLRYSASSLFTGKLYAYSSYTRQTRILDRLCTALTEAGKEFMILLVSELKPEKLSLMESSIEAWIQIACPRLSIDWGGAFSRPLLTPYEAYVAIGKVEWRQSYPMDYYKRGGEEWTNYHKPPS